MYGFNNTNIISAHGFIYNIATIRPANMVRTGSFCNYPPFKSNLIQCNYGPNVLYLHVDSLPFYLEELKIIKAPFVLLCGDADWESRTENIFIRLILNHPFLKRFYCQNWGSKPHPKVVSLPIGLDFHTLNKNKYSMFKHKWGNYAIPSIQEKQIMNIKKPKTRQTLCYVNFKHSRKIGDRNEALNNVPKNLLYIESNHLLRVETWEKMVQFKYVISPHGNGLDCHRTWEAICLGCIPIVKKSSLSESGLYNDLPVLVVDKWSDVTIKFLNNNSIEPWSHLPLQLTLNYWKQKIYSELN